MAIPWKDVQMLPRNLTTNTYITIITRHLNAGNYAAVVIVHIHLTTLMLFVILVYLLKNQSVISQSNTTCVAFKSCISHQKDRYTDLVLTTN